MDDKALRQQPGKLYQRGTIFVLLFKKISFNTWLFMILGLQYALMHLFAFKLPDAVTMSEIIVFLVYTLAEIFMFIYRGRRAAVGAVSGMIPLFFSVLWTVALFSHFQSEVYQAELTVINSLGMFTAYFTLFVEYIFMIRD